MSVSKPYWWFSEDENIAPRYKDKTNSYNSPNNQQAHNDFNDHSDVLPKRKKKSKISKLEKSDNQTIKELTRLLISKTEVIETLQIEFERLKKDNTKLWWELDKEKTERGVLYTDNCVLRKIIEDLDLDKPRIKNEQGNVIFLSEDAPQEVVDVVWKTLSKIYHPDCGGSEEKMKKLNLARDSFYSKNNWK